MVALDLVVFAGDGIALAPASDDDSGDHRMETGLLDMNESGEGMLGTVEPVLRFDGRRWAGVHLQDHSRVCPLANGTPDDARHARALPDQPLRECRGRRRRDPPQLPGGVLAIGL